MKTQYREMFDEVHASPRLKEEVLNMTRQEKTRVARKISVSFVIAAALAVILAGTALAAVIGVPETLQEWFGKQWAVAGGSEEMPKEQNETIERFVQPVGVTCSGYGVTVTLDSVTPGENCLWMYLKVKGEKLTDPWQFIRTNVIVGNLDHGKGMAIYPMSDTVQGEQDLVIQYNAPEDMTFLEGGRLILELNDIVLMGEMSEKGGEVKDYALLTGSWALPFILEPVENQEMLTAESAIVPARKYGENLPKGPVTIRDIRVTMTGLSFEEGEPDPEGEPALWVTDVTDEIFLQMKDGTEFRASGGDRGLERTRYNWRLPVDLSKAESIRFGDVVVPLSEEKT